MYFINAVFFYVFTAGGHQRLNTLVWGLVSAASLIISITLVPGLHQMGAALGFIGSLALGVIINLFFAYRNCGVNVLPVLSRFVASALLAVLPSMMLPNSTLVSASLGIAVYLATLAYFKTVSYRECEEWLGAVRFHAE